MELGEKKWGKLYSKHLTYVISYIWASQRPCEVSLDPFYRWETERIVKKLSSGYTLYGKAVILG